MQVSMASLVAVALVEALVVAGAGGEMAPYVFIGSLERDLFRFGTEIASSGNFLCGVMACKTSAVEGSSRLDYPINEYDTV